MDQDFNNLAGQLIGEERLKEASALLEKAVRHMPPDWKPAQEDARFIEIAFWDEEEFLAFVRHRQDCGSRSVIWVCRSYSKAWYLLGALASKQDCLERALFCCDCGIKLEPDHPELWSQKGVVLAKLKRHEAALDCFCRAATVRKWAPEAQVARALRGQGVQLVDLGRMDEAEAMLRRSLDFEPDSDVALKELKYIEQLRTQDAKVNQNIPWFLHWFVDPPTDPLTVQLLAVVEGLPSIPGPKTVGAENYSNIVGAFMDRGWVGFEEQFNRIAPADRLEYQRVKRDLLCEPLFNMRAQRNLARAFMAAGGDSEEKVEDVLDQIFANGDEQHRPQ